MCLWIIHSSTGPIPFREEADLKKLILKIDTLRVESFEVSDRERAGGTVRAHATVDTGPCDCAWSDTYCVFVCP